MEVRPTPRVVVVLTLVAFTCTACTTRVPVALPQATAASSTTPAVTTGDKVRVTLRDGGLIEGKAEAVATDAISVKPYKSGSASQRIMWVDVAKLERQKTHVGKTVLAVSLGVVGVLVLWTIIDLASEDECWPVCDVDLSGLGAR